MHDRGMNVRYRQGADDGLVAWEPFLERTTAERQAAMWRGRGYIARIYRRQLAADGVTAEMHVVVARNKKETE
jgi:hypothetical protein